jgi:hypothetical protein
MTHAERKQEERDIRLATDDAIMQFRAVESARYVLDSAERRLAQALAKTINQERYVEATEHIIASYELKRSKLK